MFQDKTLLITGGTGSFGNTVIRTLIERHEFREVIVFSRDEKKQHEMRMALRHPAVRFIIGDVRDRDAIFQAMAGVDLVFHAAALKHVPVCEFFPLEAFKTNVLGASNVLDAAEAHDVEKVVVLSTDKAVYPINAMGLSKAMMEKLVIAKTWSTRRRTVFSCVRYGNVMFSRGSVIPLFVRQIKEGQPLTVTSRAMTRFLLPLPEAIELVLFALAHSRGGDVLVRKSPASTTGDLALACRNVFGVTSEVKEIGIREGEKMHETLVNWEESLIAEDLGEYYRVGCDREVDYDAFLSKGQRSGLPVEGYTSLNTRQLAVPEIEALLLSLRDIQEELATWDRERGRARSS